MKKTKIIYWIFTGLFAALMLLTSIPDIMNDPKAVEFMTMLGYPDYFTPFIGVAKVLGIVAILIPGFPRITEWAYAGLVFDLIGATYSQMAKGLLAESFPFMIIAFVLAFGSYFYYHRLLKKRSAVDAGTALA